MSTNEAAERLLCAEKECNRVASAFRIVVAGKVAYLCSRHAAIYRHNREEGRR